IFLTAHPTQVYSGDKVNQLTPVAANRGGYDSSSRYPFRPCYFRATAGEELYLAMYEDGISDRQVDNSVTGWIKPVPVATNDAFDAAIELASRKEGIQFFASPGATWDAQEPGGPREHGTLLWWRWTAPEDGSAMLLLRAGEEQTVNVYTGQDPASLKPIELNDSDPLDGNSSGLKLARTFDVTAGTEYRLAIGRDRGVPIDSEDWSDSNDPWAQSAFNLGMVRRPVNDNIADAIDLGNDRAILAWSTSVLATQEPNEPVGLEPQRPRTLWWTWTAPETGSYWISDGPDYNIGATCEVFIANEDGSLQLVRTGFRGLSQYPHSHCMLRATRGVRYTIKIGTYNQMPVQINIREAFAFENDFFGDAIDLGQVNVAHSVVSGYGASSEFDELHVANGTGTIWWRWTAPATESYQITVGPSDSSHSRIKPPILTVYQGNQLANLKSIAVSNTGIIELDANAGEEYVLGWQSGDSSVRQVSLKLLRSFFGQGGPFEPFPDQSRPFEYWIAQFPELSAEQRTPEASPASDGATNWLKFYFGLDPTQRLSTPGILPQISIVEDGAAAIEYQVSKGGVSAREQGMLQDILQYSVDGKRWTNVPANARKSARMGNRQLWLIPHDDAAPQMYFRVKIESTQQ
ncbi:MAG: hypothetical protein KDN22_04830, partial [Verrucomicrobiae bacterium]|nr:hypothetical protein [Verrucomicrobiae bacterium]